jgi:hypothetical protein
VIKQIFVLGILVSASTAAAANAYLRQRSTGTNCESTSSDPTVKPRYYSDGEAANTSSANLYVTRGGRPSP